MPGLSVSSILILALAMGASGCRQPVQAPTGRVTEDTPPEAQRGASPVVVELFTSEGCSSCPPADALLAELADRHGDRLIALAYHVDYWDRLGWADPYGDPAYSERQRAYARQLDGQVYTPQMVVGGTAGFVGSNRRHASQALDSASPLRLHIDLDAQIRGDSAYAQASVPEAPPGAVLHIALVQNATRTDVRRGENRGRRLEHVRVVRQLMTGPPVSGKHAFSLPDGLRAGEVRVVALVQDGPVGAVLGAAEVPL